MDKDEVCLCGYMCDMSAYYMLFYGDTWQSRPHAIITIISFWSVSIVVSGYSLRSTVYA